MTSRRTVSDLRWADHDAWWALSVIGAVILVFGAAFATLGQPDIPWMWPLYRMGVVLPSCGLTRGVVAVFRGDFARAWKFNPASPVLVVGAGVLVARLAMGTVTGRWLVPRLSYHRLYSVVGLAAVALLWLNQQQHAQFLIHNRA